MFPRADHGKYEDDLDASILFLSLAYALGYCPRPLAKRQSFGYPLIEGDGSTFAANTSSYIGNKYLVGLNFLAENGVFTQYTQ